MNERIDSVCTVYYEANGDEYRVDFGHGVDVAWSDAPAVMQEMQRALQEAFEQSASAEGHDEGLLAGVNSER